MLDTQIILVHILIVIDFPIPGMSEKTIKNITRISRVTRMENFFHIEIEIFPSLF